MGVLLATWAATIDPGSGAARSLRTILRWLRDEGHDVRSLCATPFEGLVGGDFDSEARRQGIQLRWAPLRSGREARRQAAFQWDGIPGLAVESLTEPGQTPLTADVEAFVRAGTELLGEFRPTLTIVMGAHRALHELMRRARQGGSHVVFTVRNFGYERPGLFQHVDRVLTCSEFLSAYYLAKIGLRSTAIPSPIEWAEVEAPESDRNPRYLTFVNPAPRKGVAVAARLFEALEVPTRVFASEAGEDSLRRFLDPIPAHVEVMPTTDDPRAIYQEARVLLAPSFAEPFGRVAVEAMINGVPVVAADRGGLPEALGGSGVLVPLPPRWATDPASAVTPEDVAPWVQAIRDAWDDGPHARLSQAALRVARERYAEDAQRARYRAFFEEVGGGNRVG